MDYLRRKKQILLQNQKREYWRQQVDKLIYLQNHISKEDKQTILNIIAKL